MDFRNLLEQLGSKKLLVTVGGLFGVSQLPETHWQAIGYAVIAGAYLIGQGLSDFGKEGEKVKKAPQQ